MKFALIKVARFMVWPGVIFWLFGALIAIDVIMVVIATRTGHGP